MNSQINFIETKEYKKFAEFCDSCAKYKYIGICHGTPGVGKTVAAKHYSNWNNTEKFITSIPYCRGKWVKEIPEAIVDASTLFVTAPTIRVSSIHDTLNQYGINLNLAKAGYFHQSATLTKNEKNSLFSEYTGKGLYNEVKLIIVDEVDRLKTQTIEILRDIYDQNNIGMVFIGMPGIEHRLSRYPQLYSRVGFLHEYKKMTSTEIKFILEHKWKELGLSVTYENYDNYEAINSIIKLSNGNFRLVQRLFSQIERIMEINKLQTVTTEVVQTARESLIIGKNN